MNFQAVIFDLDGTLLDTLRDLSDAMNNTLERFGYPVHEPKEYRYLVGNGMENLVHRALPAPVNDDPQMVARGLETMRKSYALNWNVHTKPYPGIPELLEALSTRGIKLAVLSNKPHDFTLKTVEGLLPARLFDLVAGAKPNVPLKPDPASALEIAQKFGVAPDRFLYLGDTGTDMKTANAAGMFAVGVLWGFREAAELVSEGAAKLIAKPAELLDLL